MKCKNCQSDISESDFNCPSCGRTTAQSREDLQKIDPQSTRVIAWLLLALGVAGVVFVIANSATDWYSPLNFNPAGYGPNRRRLGSHERIAREIRT